MKVRKESGITLISLIITIILILVLAGISISLAVGENGILRQTQNAVTSYNNSQAKEKAKIYIAEWEVNTLTKDDQDLYSFLQEKEDVNLIFGENTELYNLEIDGQQISITAQGKVIEENENKITLSATHITLDDFIKNGRAYLYDLTAEDTSETGDLIWEINSPDETNLFFDETVYEFARIEYFEPKNYGDVIIRVRNSVTNASAICVIDTSSSNYLS